MCWGWRHDKERKSKNQAKIKWFCVGIPCYDTFHSLPTIAFWTIVKFISYTGNWNQLLYANSWCFSSIIRTVQLHTASHLTTRVVLELDPCYLHGLKFSLLLSPHFGCCFTQLLIIRKTKQIHPVDAGFYRKPMEQKAKEHHPPFCFKLEARWLHYILLDCKTTGMD